MIVNRLVGASGIIVVVLGAVVLIGGEYPRSTRAATPGYSAPPVTVPTTPYSAVWTKALVVADNSELFHVSTERDGGWKWVEPGDEGVFIPRGTEFRLTDGGMLALRKKATR